MPVIISEVITEVPQEVVPENQSVSVESSMPVSQPEFEFMQTLALLEERQQRLRFD